MKYISIVAMGRQREIGRKGELLWHLPYDMNFFKEITSGHTVVMGRKSWESIPEKFRPLPNRKNFVVTRNMEYKAEGATVINDLRDLPKLIDYDEDICFIIGGAQIYQLAFDYELVDEMLITHVDQRFTDADTFFPYVNWDYWDKKEILAHQKDEKNAYSIKIFKYTH